MTIFNNPLHMAFLNLAEKSMDCVFALLPRPMPTPLNAAGTYLIAHRGAHDRNHEFIENTDAAFARALALGCWGIELDVHATADEVLVVNHDPSLKRLWGKNALISELSFKKLHQLAPKIPTLAEVVARYGKRMHLFIELKTPFIAIQSLKTVLQPLNPGEDYHLLSLKEPLFSGFTDFPSKALLLVAVHNNVNRFCDFALEKNYGGVLGHYFLFNTHQIESLKGTGKRYGVGMIDSKFSLYRELNRNMPWIFSNNVGLISPLLHQLRN